MLLDLLENMYPEWVAGSNGTIELQVVDRALAGENPVNGYSAMKQLVEGVLAGVILCLANRSIVCTADQDGPQRK